MLINGTNTLKIVLTFLAFCLSNASIAQGPIDFGTLTILNSTEIQADINLSGGFRDSNSQGNYLNMSFPFIQGSTFDVIVNLNPSDFDANGETFRLFAVVVAPGDSEDGVLFALQEDSNWEQINESGVSNPNENLETILGGIPFSTNTAESVISISSVNSILSHADVVQQYGDTPLGLVIGIGRGEDFINELRISNTTVQMYITASSSTNLERTAFEHIDGVSTTTGSAYGAAFDVNTGVQGQTFTTPNNEIAWMFDESDEIDVLIHLNSNAFDVGLPAQVYLLANVNGLSFIRDESLGEWLPFDSTIEGLRSYYTETELSPVVPILVRNADDLIELPGITELENGGYAVFFFVAYGTGTGSIPADIYYTPSGVGISIQN